MVVTSWYSQPSDVAGIARGIVDEAVEGDFRARPDRKGGLIEEQELGD
jgi:hypothetical protein